LWGGIGAAAVANRSLSSSAAGRWPGRPRWRLIPVRANGQLAFCAYAWDDKTQTFVLHAVNVLTLRGAQIQEITAFLAPDAFRGFDLPAAVPANS
jgi:RNA polymerase sigma-70 factor, ECF subfamily